VEKVDLMVSSGGLKSKKEGESWERV